MHNIYLITCINLTHQGSAEKKKEGSPQKLKFRVRVQQYREAALVVSFLYHSSTYNTYTDKIYTQQRY